jgi:hypothetical protein
MPTLRDMLDRSFRLTFANLSTLFLVVAVVAVPLHLAHSFVFKEVIEVAELHDEIEAFPADRTVRDVGPLDLRDYRLSLGVLSVLELGLLLVLVRPTRRVITDHLEGRVPTATGAWARGLASGGGYIRALLRRPGPLLAASVVAALIGLLAERAGLLAFQPLGDRSAWIGVALAGAVARSLAAPFLLVTWALSASETKEGVSGAPKLY